MSELKSESKLEKLLAKGEFVVTGELGPPKSVDVSVLDEKIDADASFLRLICDPTASGSFLP